MTELSKEFKDTALSEKDYDVVGDGIHDDRQALRCNRCCSSRAGVEEMYIFLKELI